MIIPISKPSITALEKKYVREAVDSEWISSLGIFVTKFEEKLAEFCNVNYALSCSNGTTALHLAIKSFSLDNFTMAVPNFTFVSPYNMARLSNPTTTHLIEPSLINKCIDIYDSTIIDQLNKYQPDIIIVVHAYGYCCDINLLKQRLNYAPKIIEDCAEAHGAQLNGNSVGGIGDIGCFSFYGNKILTSGEGGGLTTNNLALYQSAKSLRDHAMDPNKRYYHTELGFNYRMTNLQAAIGLAQLERASEILEDRERILESYRREIQTSGIFINKNSKSGQDVNWLVCLEWEHENLSIDELIAYLRSKDIDSRPFFRPISSFPYVTDAIIGEKPNSEKLSRRGINLPTYFNMKESDIKQIGKCVNEYFSKIT